MVAGLSVAPGRSDQILSVAQMVAAEQALIDAGMTVEALMRVAGRGAGEFVWRMAAGRPVTVLCGPGNNGGDGYVLAEMIRERGGEVAVVAVGEPVTPAARQAREAYGGQVLPLGAERQGGVFVDCLFGSGLNRGLPQDYLEVLTGLAERHERRVAIDLPSGVASDSGALLNDGLPGYDLTVALGAWKFAHWTMPAAARMGSRRLVGIGIAETEGAARLLGKPALAPPAPDAHKYSRGLLGVVGGAMPGAALLACAAARHGGAGYVRLLCEDRPIPAPPDLVVEARPLAESLADRRIAAILAGPGLGRDGQARERLVTVLCAGLPTVLDADALILLEKDAAPLAGTVLTPHEGELQALERTFGLEAGGDRRARAAALTRASGAVVLLKGPDTVIAAPDGRLACAPPATSWLATAGTGDVLAGIIASRMATGADPWRAAREGLWLHGEAARRAGPAFSALDLAGCVPQAIAAALG